MPRNAVLERIRQLDPARDHVEIVSLDTTWEFPFDVTKALEFALFRTYAVPSISRLLHETGEFVSRPRKRYDDTDLLLSEITHHGYDSERGRAAIRRMNQHHRFTISNDDYLYTLSTFIFEPARWIARFGYRPMLEGERLAWYYFWCEVGQRMNIKNIPASYAAFEQFNLAYEQNHFRYATTNRQIAAITCDLFLGFVLPRWLWPLGEPAIYALLDEPLRRAFEFPAPAPALRWIVTRGLRLRSRIARLLPRRQPTLRTQLKRPTYPDGYRIEELGPSLGAASTDHPEGVLRDEPGGIRRT